MTLKGKTALVTGGSRGIGAAIARRLAAEGARVGVHCRANVDAANVVIESILQTGGSATLLTGDVANPNDCRTILDTITRQYGSLDILVNNAGIIRRLNFGDLTVDDFQEQFNTNVLSVVLMSQEAVRRFPPDGGRIINVSSNLAFGAFPGVSVYSATKAAVVSLTHCFAKELGKRGITVNAVAPGGTETDMVADIAPDVRSWIVENTPLGRFGQPGDIADVVAFLASDAARWVTGCTLRVDGGFI